VTALSDPCGFRRQSAQVALDFGAESIVLVGDFKRFAGTQAASGSRHICLV
jgi:hypothetical protein